MPIRSWSAAALHAPARMKILQLTAIVRDVQTATMVAQAFTRSPVLVGRQFGNLLRLDASSVSRRHGALLFSKNGLQYIDYASANGSYIDGVRVEANTPIDIRDSSVITIAPFQIVAHIDLVDPRRLSNDPNASTPVMTLLPRSAPPEARSSREILDIGGAARESLGQEPNDLLQRATSVIAIVAERLLAAGSRTAATQSPLRFAASPDEMIALLLDPNGGPQRLVELRDLVAELLRPRLTSVP